MQDIERRLLLVGVAIVVISGLYWFALPRQDNNESKPELETQTVSSDSVTWYIGEWHGKYSYRGPCYAQNYLIGMIAERKEYFGEINYVPLYVARGEKTILDGITYTVIDIEGDYIVLGR